MLLLIHYNYTDYINSWPFTAGSQFTPHLNDLHPTWKQLTILDITATHLNLPIDIYNLLL